MDPVSILIGAMVIAAFITERLPEAAAEVEYAKRGEQSPVLRARLQRLADAGIDPATGGAMRQYLANAWRDTWLDLDTDRQRRRSARQAAAGGEDTTPVSEPSGPGWWRNLRHRLADRIDQAASDHANRWRTRTTTKPVRPAPTPEPTGNPGPETPDWADDPDPEPFTSPVVHDDDTYTNPSPGGREEHQPSPDPPDDQREPIRVTSTVGDPITDPCDQPQSQQPAIEGAVMGSSLASTGSAVTGVLSGAAEARAIARQLEAANTAYITQLQHLRNRIASLGEQTAAIVQLSVRGETVGLIVQAAEAAAAAQAAAKGCGVEVAPLMGSVARSFDRLNS